MPNLLVFQHVPHEGLGSFEKNFLGSGWRVNSVLSPRTDLSGKRVGDFGACDAVMVMGGPMSANDGEKLPFIREELRLIEETLTQGLPFLGICLGSQMLAKVLGAPVFRGSQKEIGWYPLELTEEGREDALLRAWPKRGPMFQWHGETFDLPPGARRLAWSELYPNQAYRYGTKAYGFQFHPEMTSAMVEAWLREGEEEIAAAKLPHGPDEIRRQTQENISYLDSLGKKVVEGFVSL